MFDWKRVREFVTGRWFIKIAFLAYFVFACVQLMRFLAWLEGRGPLVGRPEIVAGLLPVGHFTSFFAMLRGGGWDTLLPAGLIIIVGALAASVLFKRGFCGWICPVGTVWEVFSAIGRRLLGERRPRLPKWLDLIGRTVRWVIAAAAVFLLSVVVPLDQAVAFRALPYMWVADLKILGLMLTPTFGLVALVAAGLSVLFGPVWCRYLCPLGGLYSALSVASVCRVSRDAERCTHCHSCRAVCHASVDVEARQTVRDSECDGCMECVKACPSEGCLKAVAPGGVRIAAWVWPMLVVGLWLAIFSAAKLTGNWDTHVTADQFRSAVASGVLERSSMPRSNQ